MNEAPIPIQIDAECPESLARLRGGEALFRAIADYTRDWESWIGSSGTLLWVNPAVERFTGYSPEGYLRLSRPLARTIHPPDLRRIAALLREALEHPAGGGEVRFRIRHRGGGVRWVEAAYQSLCDDQGRVAGLRTSVRDITDQVDTEQRLRAEQRRLQQALDALPANIAILDQAGRIQVVNEAWRRFARHNALPHPNYALGEEYLGFLAHLDRLPPHEAEALSDLGRSLRQVIQGARPDLYLEYPCHGPNKPRWFAMYAHHIESQGEPCTVISHFRITASKLAEQAMRGQAALLQGAFDAAAHGMAIADPEGRLVRVNPALGGILGYEVEELEGMHFADLTLPDEVEEERAAVRRMLAQRRPHLQLEKRYLRKDRTLIWCQLSISPVVDADGALRHFVAHIIDITERRQADARLRRSEEKFTGAFQASPLITAIGALADGRLLAVNDAFVRRLGHEAKEALGRTPLELGVIEPTEAARLRDSCLDAGRIDGLEVCLRGRDGTTLYAAIFARMIEFDDQPALLVQAEDVTERHGFEARLRESNRELLAAKDAAETANRAKSAFLANMSHELRTPLNAMLGYAQILQRDPTLGPVQHHGVETIKRSGDYLLTLINDVLDLAKVEAGRFDLVLQPCDLGGVIGQVAEMFRMRAHQKGIDFEYLTRTPFPFQVEADERRLRQVLMNLLGNAVKFTERGRVRLTAGFRDGALEAAVEDTGIGIPSERLPGLFRAFQQAGSAEYKSQGTGLGLAITRTLVGQMGGSVLVQSIPGEGSRFDVRIPLRTLGAAEIAAAEARSALAEITGYRRLDGNTVPLRILVVDDGADNRRVLRGLLTPLDFEVEEAATGEAGVEAAARLAPDLILMDLVLPGINGLEASRRTLALPGMADCPVIACSASAFDEDRARSRAAGCLDHLAKPVQAEALYHCLGRHLPLEWLREAADAPTTAQDHPLTPEQREAILHLIRRGDIAGIRRLLDRPESRADPNPRLVRIRELARRFDLKRMRELIEAA